MQSLVRGFIYSAGAILLFLATALFLVNLTSPADLSPINDPVFHAPVSRWFWIVGGLALAVASVCLFAQNGRLQTRLVMLFALAVLGSRICVSLLEISDGLKGYLGPLADAFGIQAGTADTLLVATGVYLLAGGFCAWHAIGGRRPDKATGEPNTKAA